MSPSQHQTPLRWGILATGKIAGTFAAELALVPDADPVTGRGYAHEITEVGECLRAGRTESELLPLDETVAIMALMDRIREQLGVRYAVD